MEIRVKRVMLNEDELMHYGVKGMKWGVRRYQNKDGSLTAAGKNRNWPANAHDENDARTIDILSKLSGKKQTDISENDRGCFNHDIHWVLTQNKPDHISSTNKNDVAETGKFLKTCWEYEIMEAERERATGIPATIGGVPYHEKVSDYYNNYVKKDPDAYAKCIIEEIEFRNKDITHGDLGPYELQTFEIDANMPSENELYHHGIKGMKWGVRRYQNKDGSLTAAGQKRRSLGQVMKDHKTAKKRKAALAKARATKAKNAEEAAKRKKALESGKLSVKKMTDDEIKASIARLENEQKYKQKVLESSTWKRFTNKLVNEAVIPAVTESGKEVAKKFLTAKGMKALGLDEKKTKSALDLLKEESLAATYKKNINETKKYFKNEADQAKKQAEAQKQVDDYNKAWSESSSSNSTYSMKGSQINNATYETGKTKTNNIVQTHGNTSLSTINQSRVNEGVAWVESSGGEFLGTTSYKDVTDK